MMQMNDSFKKIINDFVKSFFPINLDIDENVVKTDEGYKKFLDALSESHNIVNQLSDKAKEVFKDIYGMTPTEWLDTVYKKASDIYNKYHTKEDIKCECGCTNACQAPKDVCERCVCNGCHSDCSKCLYDEDDYDDEEEYYQKPSERTGDSIACAAYDLVVRYLDEEIFRGDDWDENSEKMQSVIKALKEFACWIALQRSKSHTKTHR